MVVLFCPSPRGLTAGGRVRIASGIRVPDGEFSRCNYRNLCVYCVQIYGNNCAQTADGDRLLAIRTHSMRKVPRSRRVNLCLISILTAPPHFTDIVVAASWLLLCEL